MDLIEPLERIQCLLCREAKHYVRISLELGQVICLRNGIALLLRCKPDDLSLLLLPLWKFLCERIIGESYCIVLWIVGCGEDPEVAAG